MQLFYRLIILMPEKKAWLCVFNLPYKRNMARRWHVAAHNRQNEHQEHGRMAHIMLRYMKANGGSFVFIFTFATLAKSHTKITQIVRAGFAVMVYYFCESPGKKRTGVKAPGEWF
jgi:hypothetical protein